MRARKPRFRLRTEFTNLPFWRAQGLSTRAATAVAAAGCRSLRDLSRLGWQPFETQENCGKQTLAELSQFIDGLPNVTNKYDAWLREIPDADLAAEIRRRRRVRRGRSEAAKRPIALPTPLPTRRPRRQAKSISRSNGSGVCDVIDLTTDASGRSGQRRG